MVALTIGLFAVAVLLVVDIMVRIMDSNKPQNTNTPQPQPDGPIKAPSDNEPTFKGSYLSFPTQQPPANAPHAEPAPDDQEPEE